MAFTASAVFDFWNQISKPKTKESRDAYEEEQLRNIDYRIHVITHFLGEADKSECDEDAVWGYNDGHIICTSQNKCFGDVDLKQEVYSVTVLRGNHGAKRVYNTDTGVCQYGDWVSYINDIIYPCALIVKNEIETAEKEYLEKVSGNAS